MNIGKQTCEHLKAIRKQIADANDIDYTPNECKHEGECSGTCKKCENEVRYIENQLNLRKIAGKAIKLVGLVTGMTALSACNIQAPTNAGDVERIIDTSVEALEGDVAYITDDTTTVEQNNE